ncbi:hypothetical protein LCGC14_1176090 [marine sediment metagenome]|uniref:Uncharacterized protein n=1 Tax=marine sediment metagenome TaxID=412755 RepID=A0A0F9MBE6_9ZZZZ
MPIFSHSPPGEGHGLSLRLRRTPGPGSLVATVTCHRLIGCPTHFYQRRTVPCEGDGCQACAEGHNWKWHGYISAVDHSTHEHFLFETTAQGAEPFREYFKRHDTILGCLFHATRLGAHNNGRVIIRCKPQDLSGVKLPSPPDIEKCICKIWNIATSDTEVHGLTKGHARLNVEPADTGNGRSASTTKSPAQKKTDNVE